MRVFLFFINNLEGNVFVRRVSMKVNKISFFIVVIFFDEVGWCFGFVYEIGIKNVEFIFLYNFWGRVVVVVVSLIVFVLFIFCVYFIEIFRFVRFVFIMLLVNLRFKVNFGIWIKYGVIVFYVFYGFYYRSMFERCKFKRIFFSSSGFSSCFL